jgi:hypothetical protein
VRTAEGLPRSRPHRPSQPAGDAPLCDRLPRRVTGRRIGQRAAVEVAGERRRLAEVGSRRLVGGAGLIPPIGKRDVSAFGQEAKGLAEAHLVILLDEGEHIAGGAAGMALVKGVALVGDHGEGRRVVVVERAQADVLAPARLERKVLADELHQIRGVSDPVDVGTAQTWPFEFRRLAGRGYLTSRWRESDGDTSMRTLKRPRREYRSIHSTHMT